MFNNAINSLRNTLNTQPQQRTPQNQQARPAALDYLGSRDDLRAAGIAGSKINSESGRSYVTQDRPPIQLLERLELQRQYDRHGNFSLGSGMNSVGISLARNQQVPEEHADGYVAVKTFVSHEQAAREHANHLVLGDDPRFVKALDVSHVADDGRSYLFMELMKGGDGKAHLDSVLREPTLQADEKTDLMLDAVHGYLSCLEGMHDKNLKHGDIDLKNFFHAADSARVAIGDFGSTREATPAQKLDEAVELGHMFNRDIRPRALQAGLDIKALDNVVGVLLGRHQDRRVQQDPIGTLLKNWRQIQPNHLV